MKAYGSSILAILLCASSYAASVHCDFNNDGFDDLAIGAYGEDINGHTNAGAVQVMYGRASGLSVTNNQFWHRDSPNVLGDALDEDTFGFSVACGDFNGDRFDDLAIGVPDSAVGTIPGAGSVTILYGSSTRLRAVNNQLFSQDSPGILDSAETGDSFGLTLASGDFNGDGFADLAIGAPGESLQEQTLINNTGVVNLIYGSANGLSAAGNQLWTQNSPGILDSAELDDRFGNALVAANFGKDTATDCYDDLAIGAPSESVVEVGRFEGAVNVLYGSAQGLSADGNQFWHEDSSGILGMAEPLDQFGSSLAAGEFTGTQSQCGATKIADLVVGARGKTINSFREAGAVFVIYGTDSGLTATGNQLWHQNSTGIAETVSEGEHFGHALATGHLDAGGYLVISVPHENIGTIEIGGAIHVLFTDPSTGKLSATGSKLIHQNTPGVKDTVEFADRLGLSLGAGDFNADGQDDIAVGVPEEGVGSAGAAGAVNILYSADTTFNQFFHQNTIDMKDVSRPGDIFGWSLSQ